MQVLFSLEIIILLYKPTLLPIYTSKAAQDLLQLVYFYLKQSIPIYTEASNKTGSRNLFTLSHYIYRDAALLFRGEELIQNVCVLQRYCMCRARSKSEFNVFAWYATTLVWLSVRKRLPSIAINSEINVCPVFYFFLLRWHQVIFSGRNQQMQISVFIEPAARRFFAWSIITGAVSAHWTTVLENCSW